jgi:ligand-binding sensor domain-containing protein
MRMRVRAGIGSASATVFILSVLLGSPSSIYSKPPAGTQKTWVRSGKRFTLASLEGRWPRPLPGRFAPFCSAKEVRALTAMNDTLWIGTEGGLFSYSFLDHAVAAVSGPSSISVRALAVDDSGALWVGGDAGVSVRSARGWKLYAPEASPFFSRVRCMVQGDSRFWIGTYGNGCGYVTNENLTVLGRQDSLLDERVLSIAEETPYTVFFGTASGLLSADTLGWKSLRYGSRLPIGAVKDLLFDEEGNLYLSVAEQGVAVYSFGRVRTFGTGERTPGAEVNALSLDPTGRVWAASNSGIYTFDGSEWTAYPLSGAAVTKHRSLSMHHDDEGNCYVGTDEGTVLIISRNAVREVAIPQAFPEHRVARIRFSNGSVWCIAGQSIYLFKGAFEKISAPPALYSDEMTDLLVTETREIWVTTRFGILHYAGRAWEVFDRKSGLPTEYFIGASKDAQGTLWFLTFDCGVVSYSSGTWTAYSRENGLPGNVIADLVVDGTGSPWIVTRSGEVARFVRGVWEKHAIPLLAEKAADTTLAGDSLMQFDPAIRFLPEAGATSSGTSERNEFRLGLDKAGNCLVGASNGFCRFAAGGWQAIEFPPSMRAFRLTSIIGTSKGEIWLGTAGNGLLIYRSGSWLRFGASTGLSDDYVRSLCEDQNGEVWIGTQFGGITRFSTRNGM